MADPHGADEGALIAAQAIEEHPELWNFFAAVRAVQALRGARPGVGASTRIEDDIIRFRQKPSLSFAPAGIERFGPRGGDGAPVFELSQTFFGFFGPRGPLPLHITEDAIFHTPGGKGQSILLVDFCNMLQHRMTALLYRGWASANLAASRDLGGADPFLRFTDALFGAAPAGFAGRTALPDDTRRYLAGRLSGGNRSASALAAVAGTVIGAPVTVDSDGGEWLRIEEEDRSSLGRGRRGVPARLGVDTVLGGHVFSLQTRVSVITAPLSLETYRALLPGGALSGALWSMMRHAIGLATAIALRPVLAAPAIPPCALGGGVRLGYDTWLGGDRGGRDGDDVSLTERAP